MLQPLSGGAVNASHVEAHWDELLRRATSIRAGTVAASTMLKRLAVHPRQNGLAIALREVGRIERTLFALIVSGSGPTHCGAVRGCAGRGTWTCPICQ